MAGDYAKLPFISIDFDGVLNNYTGWAGDDELYTPRDGITTFLMTVFDNFRIVIHTNRSPEKVWRWLKRYGLNDYIFDVTPYRVQAVAFIDDRAISFRGSFGDVSLQLQNFKPHWEK